jgi:hypothetical protein
MESIFTQTTFIVISSIFGIVVSFKFIHIGILKAIEIIKKAKNV